MQSSASVRNLLRNEKKARRITHPHATYSGAGVLTCQICRIQVKAEALWSQHLSGSHHRNMLQQRARQQQEQVSEASAGGAGTKRKAEDDSDEEDEYGEGDWDARKKTKQESVGNDAKSPEAEAGSTTPALPPVDEAEWAAFTRDVASPPQEPPSAAALINASASIIAAPLSAAELAARSREEASVQAKEKREAEMEGEKEDAARRIEEEMDEMEVLEDRVRKLRERRELLRKKREVAEAHTGQVDDVRGREQDADRDTSKAENINGDIKIATLIENDDDEDDDDSEDDGFGSWGMR